ncbi:MAG TPA: shikimate dehydrogenase [Chlamydiales bacterium]|nr:shikimate dehydrogenase [Chlamydiales bacterium]
MLIASVTHLEDLDKVGSLADGIELRLDSFDDLTQVKKPPRPTIFTFRKKEQGGVRDIAEAERLAQIEKLLELGPEYCDIEADTDPMFIARIAKKYPAVKLIGSYHNFQETPRDLPALLQSMYNPHFSVYKIAVTAQSTPDMLRLMIFAKGAQVPLSAISMGEYGKPSRVLGPIVGNVFDYAGLKEDEELHRYSLETLHELFHYRRLNPQTTIYGLIGNPVAQSLSDRFHNPRFKHNAVYVKMRLAPGEIPEFFSLLRQLPFGGLSVTMPLKEVVLSQMDEIEQVARSIGAVNTVIVRDGKCIGANTDGAGALNALEKRATVRGKRIALLGAGGSARAIAYMAMQRGAKVSIYNRTLERAQRLAAEFHCTGHKLDALGDYDILINTIPTAAGHLPKVAPRAVVMDIVTRPRETPLLAVAKAMGSPCVYGEEMFIEQGLLQQAEWFHSIRAL